MSSDLDHAALQLVGHVLMRPDLFPHAAASLPDWQLLEGGPAQAWRAIQESVDRGRLDTAKALGAMDRNRAARDVWQEAQRVVLNPYAADEDMIASWARALAEAGEKRRAAAKLAGLVERLQRADTRLADVVADGMHLLSEAGQGTGQSWRDAGTLADETRAMFEAWEQGDRAAGGEPTGFVSIDEIIDAMPAGEIILIGGRPSQGKTQLMLQIAVNVARRYQRHGIQKRVAIVSAETSGRRLVSRIACALIGVPAKRFQRRQATRDEWSALYDAINEVDALAPWLYVDDTSAPTTDNILVRSQALHHGTIDGERWPVGLLAFDYIELAGNEGATEEQRVASVSRGLKAIAGTLGCPLLALSQLSRRVEERNPPMPQMSDLRYSGALEADAYIILFVYRPAYYYERGMSNLRDYDRSADPDGALAYVIVAKQKDGEGAAVLPMRFRDGMWYDPKNERFEMEEEIYEQW